MLNTLVEIQSPLSDFIGEAVVFVVTALVAYFKKQYDLRQYRKEGLPRKKLKR